jgi:hypothetical protein
MVKRRGEYEWLYKAVFQKRIPLKPFGLKQNYGNRNLVKSCRYKKKEELGEFCTMHKSYGNKN